MIQQLPQSPQKPIIYQKKNQSISLVHKVH